MSKVLLVEDDNNLREIYEARLAAEGYEIVTAKDGEDALAVAKQHKPDLIISDVMMPRISGFEMLDILRNTDGLKNTKIVMLTALGQADDQSRADSLGADRYLVKSQVTLEDIVKTAEELLDPDYVPPSPADKEPASTPGVTPNTSEPPAPAPEPQPEVTPVPQGEPQQPAADAAPAATPDSTVLQEGATTVPQPDQAPAPQPPAPADAGTPTPAAAPEPVAPAPTQAADNAQPVATPAEPQTSPQPEPVASPQPQEQPELTLPTIPTDPTSQLPVTDTNTDNPITDAANPAAPTPQPEPAVTAVPNQDPVQPQDPPVSQDSVQSIPGVTPAQPADSNIPVIEQDVTVQEASPEATTEAEPKIQMPINPDTELVDTAQSASEESAAVENQINDFVQNQSETPPPRIDDSVNPPAPQATETNEAAAGDTDSDSNHEELISSAMNDLLGNEQKDDGNPAATNPETATPQTPDASAPPAPTPETVEPTEPQAPISSNQIAGKKVIHPISTSEKQADIHDLAAQEEIKENIAKGVTGAAVVSEEAKPEQPAQPGVTPQSPQANPQPLEPGGVFAPNTDGSANENAL